MSRRKRKTNVSLDWAALDDNDEPSPAPDIRIKHTQFNLDQSGASSARTSYIPAPASPVKRARVTHDDFNWNDEPAPPEINPMNYPFLDPAYQSFLLDNDKLMAQRRKRTTLVSKMKTTICPLPAADQTDMQDDPLRKWCQDDRDSYLRELIRLDGRGERTVAEACGLCKREVPNVRCEDCFGGLMFCSKCVVELHAMMPLHRVEVRVIRIIITCK
jgi:hypothetical protein